MGEAYQEGRDLVEYINYLSGLRRNGGFIGSGLGFWHFGCLVVVERIDTRDVDGRRAFRVCNPRPRPRTRFRRSLDSSTFSLHTAVAGILKGCSCAL